MKIILIILLILIFILIIDKKENYTNDNKSINNGIIEGSDPLQGQLFDNVIMYSGDKTLEGELGLEKCINKCNGMCVEYGITGDAFCFPDNNE